MNGKSSILILLLLIILLPLRGQISLMPQGMPQEGNSVVLQSVDSVWLSQLDYDVVGGGQSWNFAGIVDDGSLPDTTFFIAPSETAFAEAYPTASVAATKFPGKTSGGVEYWQITDTTLEFLGFQDSLIIRRPVEPELRLRFPFDEKGLIEQSFPIYLDVIEFRDTGTVEQQISAEAWGKITTPLGTYETLRIKRQRTENYSAFGLPVVIENTIYEFWTKEFIVPVLSVEFQESALFGGRDESLTGTYLVAQNISTAVRPAAAVYQLQVFPVPAREQITVQYTLPKAQPSTLELYDGQGRRVRLKNLGILPVGAQACDLHLGDLPVGLYQLVLRGDQGPLAIRQVVIQR